MVSAGGCPGPGSRVPSRRSITVAIRPKILRSNAVPLPVAEQPEMGIGAAARAPTRSQPRMDVEPASKVRGDGLFEWGWGCPPHRSPGAGDEPLGLSVRGVKG